MRRCLIGLVTAVLLFAVLPVTDTFTGADGTPLSSYNANWVVPTGVFRIQSNAVQPQNSFAISVAGWTGDTFANNQYSEVTVGPAIASGTYVGPAVRVNTSNGDSYVLLADGGNLVIQRQGTSPVQLSGDTTAIAAGDVMRLEIIGTALTAYKNGVLVSGISTTDSNFTSGVAGIAGHHDGGSYIETWTAGDISASGQRRPLFLIK